MPRFGVLVLIVELEGLIAVHGIAVSVPQSERPYVRHV